MCPSIAIGIFIYALAAKTIVDLSTYLALTDLVKSYGMLEIQTELNLYMPDKLWSLKYRSMYCEAPTICRYIMLIVFILVTVLMTCGPHSSTQEVGGLCCSMQLVAFDMFPGLL